ncbi:MAG: CcdB family protein [Geminicoccaceae bacterium]
MRSGWTGRACPWSRPGRPDGAVRRASLPADSIPPPIERLHLRVTVYGCEQILATNLMASIRLDQLGPKVASVADRRSEIVAAVDFLQQGF